ncbi:hypothetical protein DIPPA_25563 [Diplonema papillatum]|nr:hypothetical protein DIPPA_25563 [Diplonema papillatum]
MNKQKSQNKDAPSTLSADDAVADYRERLFEQLRIFMKSLPQRLARYTELEEKVTKSVSSDSAPDVVSLAFELHTQPKAKKRRVQEGTSTFPTTPTTPTTTPTTASDKPSFPKVIQKPPSSASISAPHTAKKIGESKDLPGTPDNTALVSALKLLKAEAKLMTLDLDNVSAWIILMMPEDKFEDNEGVEVQSEALTVVSKAVEEAKAIHGLEVEYLEARAGYESGYYKYFLARSWLHSIQLHDRLTWNQVVLAWSGLYELCLLVYKTMSQNMELILNPRAPPKGTYMMM